VSLPWLICRCEDRDKAISTNFNLHHLSMLEEPAPSGRRSIWWGGILAPCNYERAEQARHSHSPVVIPARSPFTAFRVSINSSRNPEEAKWGHLPLDGGDRREGESPVPVVARSEAEFILSCRRRKAISTNCNLYLPLPCWRRPQASLS